jgi:hypothetical protein
MRDCTLPISFFETSSIVLASRIAKFEAGLSRGNESSLSQTIGKQDLVSECPRTASLELKVYQMMRRVYVHFKHSRDTAPLTGIGLKVYQDGKTKV